MGSKRHFNTSQRITLLCAGLLVIAGFGIRLVSLGVGQQSPANADDNSLWLSLLIVLAASGTAYIIARRIAKPIREQCERAQAIADGAAEVHSPTGAGGEMATLSSALCQIQDQLSRQELAFDDLSVMTASILRTAADAIITIDERGAIEAVNPAAERMFGFDPTELIGENIKILVAAPHSEKHDGYLESYLQTSIAHVLGSTRRLTAVTKAGVEFAIQLSVSEAWSHGRRTFTGFIRDITEQVAGEQQLREAQQVANEANEVKSKFLSSMSHELRTPMNSIIGFTRQLSKRIGADLAQRDQEALGIIERNSESLLDLINGILDLVRLESGTVPFTPITYNLNAAVSLNMQSFRAKAETKGLALELCFAGASRKESTAGDLGFEVHGDKTIVHQILNILLSNAIKYTDRGGVKLTVAQSSESANYIEIKVQDTGRGISQGDQEDLFHNFAQFGKSANMGEQTGLSLVLAAKLAKTHGGSLQVQSEPGQGSVFTLRIPQHCSERQPCLY